MSTDSAEASVANYKLGSCSSIEEIITPDSSRGTESLSEHIESQSSYAEDFEEYVKRSVIENQKECSDKGKYQKLIDLIKQHMDTARAVNNGSRN